MHQDPLLVRSWQAACYPSAPSSRRGAVQFDSARKGPGALQWRHNERDGVSNYQPRDCLLNRLFGRRSKKTSKLASLAFVQGIHRGPVNSPHKGPVTRKMFPFDDVIMVFCAHKHVIQPYIFADFFFRVFTFCALVISSSRASAIFLDLF